MWLVEEAGLYDKYENNSYLNLASILYKTPFDVVVDKDRNRIDDAIHLRYDFVAERGTDEYDLDIHSKPATVLEVLVAFSDRIIDCAPDSNPKSWIFTILKNLDIAISDNSWDQDSALYVEHNLHVWIDRKYRGNGVGGPFPLRNPRGDQRYVELWYQMQSYLIENYI